MQADQLNPHLDAQLCIEIGERFVHQEGAGMADDGSAHGNALPLPAGKLARLAVEERFDAQHGGDVAYAPFDLGLAFMLHAQRKGDVVAHIHVRVERIVLKHHGDIAVLRLQMIDRLAVDANFSRGNLFETGDHAERRRFAATRGADEDHELAVLDPQIEIIDSDGPVAEMLGDFVELDYRHADDSRLAGTAGEYLLPVFRSNTIITPAAPSAAPVC